MSFSIYIGEGELYVPTDEDDNEPRVKVEGREHPSAPRFPGDLMTGNSNNRHPSYGGWAEFVEKTGLDDLFFGASCNRPGGYTRDVSLMSRHPGVSLLRLKDLEEIKRARQHWEAKTWHHPERIAGFDPNYDPFSSKPADPRYDGILARLIWLEWWVDWALANCKLPCIYNH